MLEVRVIGRTAVTLDGTSIEPKLGPKGRELFGWLALHRDVSSRHDVAVALWERTNARVNLRNLLRRLSTVLPLERYLVGRDSDVIALADAPLVSTDIEAFRQHVASNDLHAARQLAAGEELLAGITASWLEHDRQEHRRQVVDILDELLDEALDSGDIAEAIAIARDRIATDPLEERHVISAMQLLAEQGRSREARDEFRRLEARHAKADRDFEPSAELAGVAAGILGTLGQTQATGRLREATESAAARLPLNSARSYRWDAFVDAADDDDPFPAYGVQTVRMSYSIDAVPDELAVACVSSEYDSVLDHFTFGRHLFRWLIDAPLDPSNPRMFAIEQILIDGHELQLERSRSIAVPAGVDAKAVEWCYRVPSALRGAHLPTLDIALRTRVWVDGPRFPVGALVFRSVTDAEFRLVVAPRLRATKITVAAAEIKPLGRAPTPPIFGPMYPQSFPAMAAHAQFRYPLAANSGVTFEVERRT
jgi:DNA-binding SARP family transcriptional activator